MSLLLTCGGDDSLGCSIVRYHLDGRTEMLWERRSCFAGTLNISPDARHVAFTVVPYDTDVWMIDFPK